MVLANIVDAANRTQLKTKREAMGCDGDYDTRNTCGMVKILERSGVLEE